MADSQAQSVHYSLSPDPKFFPAPADDERLWRYMNFAKFVSLPSNRRLYTDLTNTLVSEGASTDQFFYKRRFFEHEREIRALRQFQPEIRSDDDLSSAMPDLGLLLRDGVLGVLDHVRVGPDAPEFFLDAVASAREQYGASLSVRRSELDDHPF